jgi:predicted neuraminidase
MRSNSFLTRIFLVLSLFSLAGVPHKTVFAQEPAAQSIAEFVFPLNPSHNHAPGIVEFPNGDLLVSWYRGSGERKADDVTVLGAWKRKGAKSWSEPFTMADQPGFPDCNTCLHVDSQGKLWLFWPTIIANSWESCLTRFQVAANCSESKSDAIQWDSQGLVLLKPDDFANEAEVTLRKLLDERLPKPIPESLEKEFAEARQRLQEKLYQRLGWQPRCKPTVLPSGRILLPLYTDTFSISIMAISDDGGKSWFASKPIYGLGNIQPSVVRRSDGTLVAYMRDNGPAGKVQVSESQDDGIHWSIAQSSEILNPGSGLDAIRLANGHWVLIANDIAEGRNRLSLLLSEDEGRTWKTRRALEDQPKGSFHYPSIIQGKDGKMHIVYSYFVDEGKTMKYVRLTEDWIRNR